jgi:hypothetical protein
MIAHAAKMLLTRACTCDSWCFSAGPGILTVRELDLSVEEKESLGYALSIINKILKLSQSIVVTGSGRIPRD